MTIVRRNCHCSHAVFSGDYGDYVTEDDEEEAVPPLLLLGLVLAALSAAGSAAVVVACRRLRPGHKYQPGPASSQDYHASLHQTSSISTIHTNCTSSNTHNRSAEPVRSSVVSQLWLYWTYSKLCGMENTETWNGTNYFRKNARTRTINRTIVVSCCSQCRTNRRGRYRLSPSA